MSDTPAGKSLQHFTWDSNESVPMLLADGTNSYIYGPGGVPIEDLTTSTSTATYLVSDPTGVRYQFKATGATDGANSYSIYGQCISCTVKTLFGFENGYTDANGLIYLINRYYDPATEQFISVDPLVSATGQPFSYAYDNPVNGSDPSGLSAGLSSTYRSMGNGAGNCSMNPFASGSCFRIGWDSMSGAQQFADATLPITLPLMACGLGEVADSAEAGGALADASSAANDAADNVDQFALSAKHLPTAGGNYAKFASGTNPYDAIAQALRSPDAQFFPNPQIPDTFRVVSDLGEVVGTRGQTAVRVIVTNSGRIVTGFPVKG